MAKFITFEGVDGAGKSTHLNWFADTLRARGIDLLVTREPGGTPLGEKLREILLHEAMHGETEALLMFAARREHIEKVIKPALKKGSWVISDRFTDASFAYQGGGRGVSVQKLEQLEQWVQGDLQPDLTLLFDIPVEVARQRLNNNVAQTSLPKTCWCRYTPLPAAKRIPQSFHCQAAARTPTSAASCSKTCRTLK